VPLENLLSVSRGLLTVFVALFPRHRMCIEPLHGKRSVGMPNLYCRMFFPILHEKVIRRET